MMGGPGAKSGAIHTIVTKVWCVLRRAIMRKKIVGTAVIPKSPLVIVRLTTPAMDTVYPRTFAHIVLRLIIYKHAPVGVSFGGDYLAFLAEYILYDGISSERFGLHLYNTNGGLDTASGSSFSIFRSTIGGGLQYTYLGREDKPPLEFSLRMVSETPLDAGMQRAIYRWLMGKNGYRELRFIQADRGSWRIGCIFTSIEFIQNGNEVVGVAVEGEGDSCYFRGEDIVITKTGNSNTFTFMNLSDGGEYVYPHIQITCPSSSSDINIVNITDNRRNFSIMGMAGGEVIEVDNLRKIITSSTTARRLSSFNKKWFRLLPGKNEITAGFSAGSGTITFTIPVYKMAAL